MNNINFFHALKTNGVQTDRTSDRQTYIISYRGASLLKTYPGYGFLESGLLLAINLF